MGTKIHGGSYIPGFYSMRDLNEDSSSSSWPVFYRDNNAATNEQYYNGYLSRNSINGYPGHSEKEALKQKMLEHETVFRNQVSELHRLYRVQRDMMEEIKRTELRKHRASIEPASSSSLQGSQLPLEDNRKWQMPGFSLLNSSYSRTPTSEIELSKSPMSCIQGNATQPAQSPLQNGTTAKNSEAADSRPSKVRKKLFDLHLPAEEYIDTEEGEKLLENKASNVSAYACNGNPSSQPERHTKLLLDNHAGVRADCKMADLNNPAQIDEAMVALSVDFLGRSSQYEPAISTSKPTKPNAWYSSFESKVNDGERFPNAYEAGSSRSNISSVGQARPMQGFLNQFHHPSGIYSTGYHGENRGNDLAQHGLEFSNRTNDRPGSSHSRALNSRAPGLHPFCSSSYSANSWDQCVSYWSKHTSNLAQNVTPFQPSAMKWHANSSSSLNPGLRINKPKQNRLPVESGNHLFGKFPREAESKPVVEINLNEASSDEVVILQDLNKDGKDKLEDHPPPLPWLKPNPSRVNVNSGDLNQHFTPKSAGKKIVETETRPVKKLLGFPIFETVVPENKLSSIASTSENFDCQPKGKNAVGERLERMIDINVACEPDQVSADELNVDNREKQDQSACVRNFIDLNSSANDCEDLQVAESGRESVGIKVPLDIDLEAPASMESDNDDDDNGFIKRNVPNDLQVLSLETKIAQTKDEISTNTAEMLVEMSSWYLPSVNLSLHESFLWFVDAVASWPDEHGRTTRNESRFIDEFETMTLRIPETREADYMPTPFAPKVEMDVDETGLNNTALASRCRRGQSRRGRQRRDFQRDILPGLISLSRHEVSEDLQTLGGIMRATGHVWNSGLTRRNGARGGGGRGRRRGAAEAAAAAVVVPMVRVANVEVGREDRSLMGWGKTTRRPRRQRCHYGNAPAIVLS
ncbi:uncharacterized protein LOC127263822 [Andrographis paniculata]|uniref:uncharacterized protein LOC127263822 n=1 Tax=Andrographis paniculata TaxID=175694 RepID=UPI0021E82820|nr:uncharacterized protein LOC127263822 [Andrographis paniculata]XP_051149015.1 uncharacterized protein LOC127263822 [Andrographis paniculata]XP_051149016.1 uncharacterized protein LOC127263822 [Andrographis paniculata]XP_051149017.1 uncharacterized protein LOC127263822 [Andrographis paniculata]